MIYLLKNFLIEHRVQNKLEYYQNIQLNNKINELQNNTKSNYINEKDCNLLDCENTLINWDTFC